MKITQSQRERIIRLLARCCEELQIITAEMKGLVAAHPLSLINNVGGVVGDTVWWLDVDGLAMGRNSWPPPPTVFSFPPRGNRAVR